MTIKNKISNLLRNNYMYSGTEYDYDKEQNCNGGCKNDYCRCSTIHNANIISVQPQELLNSTKNKLDYEISEKYNPMENPVNVYALRRLFIHHKFYEKDLFEVDVGGGYYGEEINGVTHENHHQLVQDLINILSFNSNTTKIEYLLNLEYGYIPEHYKKLNWEIKEITIENIHYLEQQMDIAYKENMTIKHHYKYK